MAYSPSSSRSPSPELRGYTLAEEHHEMVVQALKEAKVSKTIIDQIKEENLELEEVLKILQNALKDTERDVAHVGKMMRLNKRVKRFLDIQCPDPPKEQLPSEQFPTESSSTASKAKPKAARGRTGRKK